MEPTEMTDDQLKAIFDQTANDPIAWLRTADNNIIAADTLDAETDAAWKRGRPIEHVMRTGNQSLMLRGFAVECLLKGIYVNTGGKLGEGGEMIRGLPTNHDLVTMWERLDLPLLMPERRSILNKLTDVCTSLGRYPVATRWDKQKPVPRTNARFSWHTGEDQALAAILSDLKSRLPLSDQPYP